MNPPRAIIFDLDGTLIDSREDIAAACNHALTACGKDPLPSETIASYVGDGARMLIARAFKLNKESSDIDIALEHFLGFYEKNPARFTRFMPGAERVLEYFARIPIAISTNKSRRVTLAVLEALHISHRFSAVAAGGDAPPKPDPTATLRLVDRMHVAPREAWVVGDGVQDVGAGRRAGCFTIAVLGGFTSEEKLWAAEPDRVVASLEELLVLGDV